MGAFGWVDQSLNWISNRWTEDWADFRKTFTESWESLPGQVAGVNNGIIGMANAPFKDDGDFWGSARLWLDSAVNTASALAGGTIGTLFQVPILHEASWLLDKAYRYAVARPISTQFTFMSNTEREAYMQGSNPVAELWENLTDFKELQRAWNDSEYITPGQAIVYNATMAARSLGDFEASMRWAQTHDPRTVEGQKTFNSKEADFWLKYGSGSLDFLGNMLADPGHGAASGAKLAKLRLVDKVADARYILAKKVHAEVDTSTFVKVRELAREPGMTDETFRDLVMPQAAFGGRMSTMLRTAALVGNDVYRDTYLTMRALDLEAYKRLGDSMPKIAADFADMFANYTIADVDYQRGNVQNAMGADALRKKKAEAFVDAFAAGEGLWGQSFGLGLGEKMPKVRAVSKLRAGYHSRVLESAPIIVGRPLSSVMPSQGWSPMINSGDSTGMALRQFKANLERANTAGKAGDLIYGGRELILTPKEINDWTSRYGSATSDATRQAIAMQVDNLVVGKILQRYGLSQRELSNVLTDINKTRAGTRRLVANERLYMSNEARRAAEKRAATGHLKAAEDFEEYSKDFRKDATEGRAADEYVTFTDVDGRLNIVPLDTTLPVLRSQFAETITMLDYRALNGALRWWKMTHPKPKRLVDPDDAEKVVTQPVKGWEIGLAKAAKARGWYDQAINALDAMSSAWKASALLRPAQAPRNVASDTLLTMAQFGKLPLLLHAANIVPNAIRNFGPRGRLISEMFAEGLTRLRGKPQPEMTVDVETSVPGNVDGSESGKPPHYISPTFAFADGRISLRDYLDFLETLFTTPITPMSKRGPAAKAKKAQAFVPRATQGLIRQGGVGLGGNRAEKIDPDALAPRPGQVVPPPRLERQPGDPEEIESFGLMPKKYDPDAPERWTHQREEGTEPDVVMPPGNTVQHIPLGKGPARNRPESVAAPYRQWRPGAPYFVEAFWFGEMQAGRIDPRVYEQKIVNQALSAAGRNLYRQKRWGESLVKDLITRHINRRQEPGYKDNPYAPGTLVVDPYTGLAPKLAENVSMQKLRDTFDISAETVLYTRDIPKKKKGSVGSVALGDVHKQLTRWIDANSAALLNPDTFMAMRVKPDGNISVGFATAKKAVVESGATLKAGARTRWKNFRYDGIADAAHTGFPVKDGKGNVIATFDGWATGPMGNAFQRRVSARDNPTTGFGNIVEEVDIESQLDAQGNQRPIDAYETNYGENWERSVNAQIASDPVARMFLTRKPNGQYYSDADVIATVEDTAWGTKWIKAMGFRGIAYVDQIRQIEAMVNTYIPLPHPMLFDEAQTAAAIKLREAVLQKKATYASFEKLFEKSDGKGKLVVDKDVMPEVHGPSVDYVMGNSRTWKAMRQLIRGLQRQIADMPVDKWARFPFMAMAYQKHGTELVKVANSYFPDGALPGDVVGRLKEMAVEKAYHDVRYRLYDTAQRNDFANATRLLMPFSAAMMDSYIKYGRVIRENPMTLVQGAYYWDVFERNGMVQDEEGNVAVNEDGTTRFYRVDPTTGERTLVPDDKVGKHRYVQFQLPDSLGRVLGRKYYGVDAKPVIAINKDTMNVFLNTPSGGPLVAFPANEFALSNPEFGENQLVKKYLLPYGPSSSRTKVFLPTTVRSSWDAFIAEDSNTAEGHAMAIMQAELIAYGLGTRDTPPTFEEVREKAASMVFLRWAATYTSPASFQLQSPYQPYVNAYRQLLADPATQKTAAEEFMRRHGDEYYAVTMSVTRNNAGLSATLESAEQYEKYKDLIARYPEFGGLIVGSEGAGTFAKSVYEAQKETPIGPGDKRTIREMLSLQESTQGVNQKVTWAKYSQMMDLLTAAMVDRGLRSLRHRGAQDLLESKEAFVEANKYWMDPATGEKALSPWYLDYQSSDRGAAEKKFEALWVIARDEKLQNREDIRGLLEYLTLRDQMQREMAGWGFKSLENQKAWGLRNKWEQQVHDIVESNTAFADLWNRWLSNDDKLDIPSVPDRPWFEGV